MRRKTRMQDPPRQCSSTSLHRSMICCWPRTKPPPATCLNGSSPASAPNFVRTIGIVRSTSESGCFTFEDNSLQSPLKASPHQKQENKRAAREDRNLDTNTPGQRRSASAAEGSYLASFLSIVTKLKPSSSVAVYAPALELSWSRECACASNLPAVLPLPKPSIHKEIVVRELQAVSMLLRNKTLRQALVHQ